MASTKAGCHAIDEGFPFCLLLYSSDWLFVFGSNDCFIPYILHGYAMCLENLEDIKKKIFIHPGITYLCKRKFPGNESLDPFPVCCRVYEFLQ